MTKQQQKQLHNRLRTLVEAADELKRFLADGNNTAAVQVMLDSQNFIIHIVQFIESLTELETQTALRLVDSFELLDATRTAFAAGEYDTKFIKRLRKLLLMAENNAAYEFKPDSITMVFLPYKASMWDAMESIWLAARNDPRCEAIVVPIPYYDRVFGGAFGEMQYEGRQYPAYVPVVDWRTFNLEERHPDIVYIHNPYDGANFVTSVHPNYYSDTIKRFTDLLVYVPYYVTDEVITQGFTTSPGIYHAHKTFAQSERVRGNFMQYHNGDKIVALGSPKFDKIINARREDFTLPVKWQKLLMKPDGGLKKVVLYNTTIIGLLGATEMYLNKLLHVFSIFQNREDVVLWWRPHPLLLSTMESMRPHLLPMYKQIVSTYRRAGFGIYDDTADLHRALCYADAFYGDNSSLLPMIQCTPKPVMVQNVLMDSDTVWNAAAIGLLEAGATFWLTTMTMNALYSIDKEAFQAALREESSDAVLPVVYAGSLPGMPAQVVRASFTILEAAGTLWFSPIVNLVLRSFDPQTGAWRQIELPPPRKLNGLQREYDSKLNFWKMNCHNDTLYLFGYTYPGIIKYDLLHESTTILDDWVELLNPHVFDTERGYFSASVFDDERDCFIFPAQNANALVEFDGNTGISAVYHIGEAKYGYIDIVQADGEFWLLAYQQAALVCWNPTVKSCAVYPMALPELPPDRTALFSKIIPLDGELLLVPLYLDRFVKFNLADKSFHYADEFGGSGECFTYNKRAGYYYTVSDSLDMIYLTAVKDNALHVIDPKTAKRRIFTLRPSAEDAASLQEHLRVNDVINTSADCILYESPYMADLHDLLDAVMQEKPPVWLTMRAEKQVEFRKGMIANGDGTAGAKIYEHCKKAVLGE